MMEVLSRHPAWKLKSKGQVTGLTVTDGSINSSRRKAYHGKAFCLVLADGSYEEIGHKKCFYLKEQKKTSHQQLIGLRYSWIRGGSSLTCEYSEGQRRRSTGINTKKSEVLRLGHQGGITREITVIDEGGSIVRSFTGRYKLFYGAGLEFITPNIDQLRTIQDGGKS
jgi:hypothetical protein